MAGGGVFRERDVNHGGLHQAAAQQGHTLVAHRHREHLRRVGDESHRIGHTVNLHTHLEIRLLLVVEGKDKPEHTGNSHKQQVLPQAFESACGLDGVLQPSHEGFARCVVVGHTGEDRILLAFGGSGFGNGVD